jgi:hypothetical protein
MDARAPDRQTARSVPPMANRHPTPPHPPHNRQQTPRRAVLSILLKSALLPCLLCLLCLLQSTTAATTPPALQIAAFDIDATPPVGSRMAYDPVTNRWDLGLRARGIVILGAQDPIVLCAVDWIGIANEGYDAFRAALARAAHTSPRRVAVHALHQHDAPYCDFSAEKILRAAGRAPREFESGFQRQVISNLQQAVTVAIARAQPITHLGLGSALVEDVASNRRILGPDGKVRATRWTATRDPELRAEPEGLIDPFVSVVGLWNQDKPVAVLSYYATHPQSYYRTGMPNPDFPGLARFLRQLAVPTALHLHFTGAAGNIGAGKYNDGAPENRLSLAERLADGMRRAWERSQRLPLTPDMVSWTVEPVALPLPDHLNASDLEQAIASAGDEPDITGLAARLAWLRRAQAGHTIELTCLAIGPARILHLPGELFVEYQLAAKAMRSDLFVAMAAYADYAPWYIGTETAYSQGGYETGPAASNVAPEVETVLLAALRKLLAGSRPAINPPGHE